MDERKLTQINKKEKLTGILNKFTKIFGSKKERKFKQKKKK